MKLTDIIGAQSAIQKIVKQDLPIKTAFELRKNLSLMQADVNAFEDQRKQLIAKYGEVTPNGFVPKDQNKKGEIEKALAELLNIECDCKITAINSAAFGEQIRLTVQDLESLIRIGLLKES